MYAKNTLVITATGKKIVKISITANDPDTKKYNGNDEAYALNGETKVTITKVSDTQVEFSGLSASTITVVNDYSGTSGGVQLRIKSITITYAN
ncbi:MAG: hypothetical protein LKF06_09270 [Prevotella sp.]|jgi:hypothetical protein|nr:hypothetical protein [Prevotella sp.]